MFSPWNNTHCSFHVGKIFENLHRQNSVEETMKRNKHMKTITKLIYLAFAVVTLCTAAATANGAVNDLFVSVNGSGSNGGGFIYHYTSTGVRSIFSSGLSRPRGVAFDQFTNLFVATNTFHPNTGTVSAAILKILPNGTP